MPASVSLTFLSDKWCVYLCQRWICFLRVNARLEASHRYSSGSAVTKRNHSLCRTRWLYWIWWERCWEAFNRFSSSGHPSLSHSFCFLPNRIKMFISLGPCSCRLILGANYENKISVKSIWNSQNWGRVQTAAHLGNGLISEIEIVLFSFLFFVGGAWNRSSFTDDLRSKDAMKN